MDNLKSIPNRINIAPRGKTWLAGKLVDGEAGHPTWQGMQSHAQKTLIAHAEGRELHMNAGSCPDGLEGYKTRDGECPVCQALMTLDAE